MIAMRNLPLLLVTCCSTSVTEEEACDWSLPWPLDGAPILFKRRGIDGVGLDHLASHPAHADLMVFLRGKLSRAGALGLR
jgi:hypothetical protein